ncbi:MAG: energy transducer TonB, partial [Pseudomonadota bacterium]
LLVNLLLFTAIELMVGSKRVRLTPTDDFDIANFIRLQEESRDVRSRRDPNAPQKPQNEMQRDFERLSSAGSSGLGDLMLDVPQFDIDLGLELGGVALARELTPLVRVPPEYPIKALTEEIEGFVVLRFIVTETGSVEDPEVVRADPPRIFDRAALRAVTRWKFQPQIRDGKASRVVAITRVAFVLAEE